MTRRQTYVALNAAWASVATCAAAVAAIEAAQLHRWLTFVFTALTAIGASAGCVFALLTLRYERMLHR
jgi:hypothetical protein